ncbi:NDR1/HIN1-like protein 6 [Aristolochia californica]|uniref:NDR1/HIN1-like protein 6 n=1 Tax=Aristolochia californica TaxID=171875 RepID=UPI0035DCAC35
MTDRVYPSAKPQNMNGGANPTFPATKAQIYGATRPPYRPQPKPPRHRRGCCCRFCCWSILFVLALILLIVIAGGIVWVLYRPQRPSFFVSSLKISTFNVSSSPSSPQINSLISLTLTARNPNKKLVYYYDPMSIAVSSAGVDIADGTVPAFVHGTKNSTTLSVAINSGGPRKIDSGSAGSLRSDLNKKGELPLEIAVETKVKVKMGALKSNKVGIKVTCDGINAAVPKGKEKPKDAVSDSNVKCKVKLRIKIWKWQI